MARNIMCEEKRIEKERELEAKYNFIGEDYERLDEENFAEAEEIASANEEGEFSEATINRIRTREDARQREIGEAEG